MTTFCPCEIGRLPDISPETMVERTPLEITSRVVWPKHYYTEWELRCTACGRRYKVRDDQSYWKPLYTWESLDAE
ncbi:MAG: hypothetical protein CR993_00020 [Rhodobacterales bacterium]|nr:MAG: hypothetical protein CR993_00020 [Rhodobacterales bacterium]